MPIVAILLGAMMIDLAFRGTEHEAAQQLAKDFGGGEFWSWSAAIVALGALGYIRPLRPVSTAALALVLTVLVLKNGGFFTQLSNAIKSPPQPAAAVTLASYQSGSGSSSGSSGGSGGGMGGILAGFGGGSGGGSGGISSSDIQTAAEAAAVLGVI